MRSNMVHSFSNVPNVSIPRSSFNRTSTYKTTFDADDLVPIFVDEVVPGDSYNLQMRFLARLATPLYPIMDNIFIDSFWFFVPYRLVWENWKKFQGEQANPADSIDYTVPIYQGAFSVTLGSVGHYMGTPLGLDVSVTEVSCLPGRAYRLIWNDWFRDENLQDSLVIGAGTSGIGDGPDNASTFGFTNPSHILKRGKRHDYFTSCLPWPQKGDAVSLPLGTTAPVEVASTEIGNALRIQNATTKTNYLTLDASVALATVAAGGGGASTIYADLTNAASATINDLRLAFQTQRLLERDARSGTRYNELILAHFGVTVPDYRVQRPEFLGGGSTPVNISPVAQTSGQPTPVADDKLGNLAAIGTAAGSHGFTKSFNEHGIIIGIINARSDITYSQGLERFWSRQTRYDFYMPVLSQIGEQAVLNKELFHNPAGTDNDDVFGYQERYAEYRYKPSRLTGLFAVDAAGTLAAWHLSEDFASLPLLDDTFITSNTSDPLDRALAIPSEPHFIFDSSIALKCARPMPLYGVPGNLDHF